MKRVTTHRSPQWRRLALLLLAVFLVSSAVPVVALRWYNPPVSAFMLLAAWSARWHGDSAYRQDFLWVASEFIAPEMKLAVLAAEDQRFPYHHGFDLNELANAMQETASLAHARGASTVTQQVAKNLFLWPGRSFVRKGLEAYFTLLLELCWPKRRILEIYLNIAQFGHGIYGVEAASRHYFGRSSQRLTTAQAALLAAALPNPRLYRIDQPSAALRRRQFRVLQAMQQLGGTKYLDALSRPRQAVQSRLQ